MNKEEILARLKPVLSSELYSAIETVFANEAKLTAAAKVFTEVAVAKRDSDFVTHCINTENRIDAMRSREKYLFSLKEDN